jgi:hypothetical protein
MMKIALRILAALLALAILYGVVQLGIASGKEARFVVWFGIASAIAAPIGLSLFAFAVSRSDRELFQKLAKVPEVQKLMEEARTQEEKVRVLQAEQARLEEIVRLESRRQAAQDRVANLERDAQRILKELDFLESDLRTIDASVGAGVATEEIARLRERIKARDRGDVLIRLGARTVRIDRDMIKAFPFGVGNITLAYLRLIERLQRA